MDLERDVERRFVFLTKTHGGLVFKMNAGIYKGIPDRLLVLPGADGPEYYWVELKKPDGVAGKLQVDWERRLRKAGCMYARLYSVAEVNEFFRSLYPDSDGGK